jgi:PUA-domain protein
MAAKVILKERESKPLIDELKKIDGYQQLSHKSRVELQPIKNAELVFVDGHPVALRRSGELIPTLVNNEAIVTLPKVVVDMGAVPHVVGGADIMAPGIRKVQGVFSVGQLLVIVDEKHGKGLALGRALQDSSSISKISKGKVIQNLHYVGDSAWELIKTFSKSPQAGS